MDDKAAVLHEYQTRPEGSPRARISLAEAIRAAAAAMSTPLVVHRGC
jgi:hypothetical protein